MALKTKLAIYGWIRENYNGTFLDDISDIIHTFYLIKIDSKILTTNEQAELSNLLLDEIKTKKGNENVKYFDTEFLFRASEHDFKASKFHEICDKQGPTIVLYHNEHDHIFGGYAPQSWNSSLSGLGGDGRITDPTAFLWMIRPYAKVFRFKQAHSSGFGAMWNSHSDGPKFGKGSDVWVTDACAYNGVGPVSFDFDGKEISGADCNRWGTYSFDIKDYEVFKIFLH